MSKSWNDQDQKVEKTPGHRNYPSQKRRFHSEWNHQSSKMQTNDFGTHNSMKQTTSHCSWFETIRSQTALKCTWVTSINCYAQKMRSNFFYTVVLIIWSIKWQDSKPRSGAKATTWSWLPLVVCLQKTKAN